MQRERRQRRTELMGRVRQELPLRGDGLGDARQKALDRGDERPDLERQPRIGNLGSSPLPSGTRGRPRCSSTVEHPADRRADHERQKNDQAQEGATVRSALLFAISLRTAVCWPTAIRRPRSWLLMTNRQGAPPMATVWRPSGALALRPGAAPCRQPGTLRLSGQDNEPRLRICVRRSGRLSRRAPRSAGAAAMRPSGGAGRPATR